MAARRMCRLADRSADQMVELTDPRDIEAFGKLCRSSPRFREQTDRLLPEKRLYQMGIRSMHSLRAALREYFIFHRQGKVRTIDELTLHEYDLVGAKIPGFFPTPEPLARELVQKADIQPGNRVLEPSAGKGNIAEAIRDRHPDCELVVVERFPDLRKILELKGFNLVSRDFLEHQGAYDRIVMNPPFENGQDIDHVRHAYTLLAGDGRLVSVMSQGPFFRSDNKGKAFRKWLEENGGWYVELPEDAFKESGTGVKTMMVVLDK